MSGTSVHYDNIVLRRWYTQSSSLANLLELDLPATGVPGSTEHQAPGFSHRRATIEGHMLYQARVPVQQFPSRTKCQRADRLVPATGYHFILCVNTYCSRIRLNYSERFPLHNRQHVYDIFSHRDSVLSARVLWLYHGQNGFQAAHPLSKKRQLVLSNLRSGWS